MVFYRFIVRKIILVERDNQKWNAHPCPRLTVGNSKRRDLQKEILPKWQSALKWGLGEVQPSSTPSNHTGELPSHVLPQPTQSLPQVINQWFRPLFHDSTVPIHSTTSQHEPMIALTRGWAFPNTEIQHIATLIQLPITMQVDTI